MHPTAPLARRAVLALLACSAGLAAAQADPAPGFPARPITLVVPYAAGGSSDTRARQVAQKIAAILGKPVVVDNKPGANGNIGTDFIAKAPADGHVIGVGNLAPLAVNRYLYPKLPFDPVADFAPIALLEKGPLVLVVNTKAPYRSVADLVAAARARPGKVTYASAGSGGSFHLAGELFTDITGTQMLHVPYKGGAPATNDLLAGTVDFMFDMLPAASGHLKGTEPRMRALAIASAKRNPMLPDVPTFAEAGLKGLEVSNWFGIVAPRGTPPGVVLKLNQAINKALADPDLQDKIVSTGNEAGGGTPEDFAKFIAAESQRWGVLIRQKGIKAD